MSPLASPPSRGYADYQRVGNFDSGVIIAADSGVRNTPYITGLEDVSRYAYLGGFMQASSGQCEVIINWYFDAAGSIGPVSRTFQLYSGIGVSAQIRLPNLGPFVQIESISAGGGNYEFVAEIIATNRVHPLEFIPKNAILFDNQAQSLAVGDNALYPSDYYAGPVIIHWNNPVAGCNLQLQVLTPTNVWDTYYEQSFAAVTLAEFQSITPPGAWRLVAHNGSGGVMNGQVIAVTPSTTGAT